MQLLILNQYNIPGKNRKSYAVIDIIIKQYTSINNI